MPFYAKRFSHGCEYLTCRKTATHQVFNGVNALMGSYCEPHAKTRVNELNADERLRAK